MNWIKRNLLFLISLLVAVGLIGAGGYFYLYKQYQREQQLSAKIQESFNELKKLHDRKPHPGDPRGVDNVQAAKDQAAAVSEIAAKLRESFKPVPQPPLAGNFSHQMEQTLADLRAAAAEAGVSLPAAGYTFTFQAEHMMVNLPPESYAPIARHLAEIKTICDILFAAKVNQIDNIYRPVIPSVETNGPEYIAPETKGSPLAEFSPYKIQFRCFSAELATVLSGFANSPHGLVVKYVDIDPGPVRTDRVAPPPPNRRPATYLDENQFQVTLMIDFVKPKPVK